MATKKCGHYVNESFIPCVHATQLYPKLVTRTGEQVLADETSLRSTLG